MKYIYASLSLLGQDVKVLGRCSMYIYSDLNSQFSYSYAHVLYIYVCIMYIFITYMKIYRYT